MVWIKVPQLDAHHVVSVSKYNGTWENALGIVMERRDQRSPAWRVLTGEEHDFL